MSFLITWKFICLVVLEAGNTGPAAGICLATGELGVQLGLHPRLKSGPAVCKGVAWDRLARYSGPVS